MVETEIKIGPIRPTSGPLAKIGGAAVSSQSGSGPLDVRVRLNEQDIRSLQDQIYALSTLLNQLISVPMLIASGPNHQAGVVPDPGSTSGTAKFLREDATFAAVSATALSGVLPVANGGTGTATGSITGTGDITFTAGGSNKTVALVSSGTGKVVAKPGTDSTTAVQVQNAAGTAVLDVDTTNGFVGIGTVAPSTALQVSGIMAADTGTGGYVRLVPGGAGQTGYIDWFDKTRTRICYLGYTDGNLVFNMTAGTDLVVTGVPVYANNAAAVTGGLTVGAFYRTGADPDPLCIVH